MQICSASMYHTIACDGTFSVYLQKSRWKKSELFCVAPALCTAIGSRMPEKVAR